MKKNKQNLKILMIGPLPPPIGGCRVLFQQLVQDLKKDDQISCEVINMPSTEEIKGTIKLFIRILWLLILKILKADLVAFHGTTRNTFYLGPFIYCITKLCGKKIIFRKFGGVFHKKYEEKNKLIKWFLKKTIFRADLWLFETKELVAYFKKICKGKIVWYPNNRKIATKRKLSKKAKKFVFIGQIRRDKGVKQIFEVSNQLPEDIQVNIYGNLGYDISKDEILELEKNRSAQFHGKLSLNEVIPTLKKYDVLLLPTFHEGEGYPGVILEAYACGLPVITTKWAAIPEIVDKDSGILINPNSKKELREAIIKIYKNKQLFNKLQKGAIEKSKKFNSKKWIKKFINLCHNL